MTALTYSQAVCSHMLILLALAMLLDGREEGAGVVIGHDIVPQSALFTS